MIIKNELRNAPLPVHARGFFCAHPGLALISHIVIRCNYRSHIHIHDIDNQSI